MPKSLTVEQVEKFHRDGFASPMTALSAHEAAAAANRLERYEADTGKSAMDTLTFKGHMPFSLYCDMIRNPRILDALEDVVGPNIVCWGSSFFVKEPKSESFISWHADTYYYGLLPQETVTAWVAFTPANRVSGCIRVIPGSHLTDDGFEETPLENNILRRGQTTRNVDESKAVFMPLEPGQFSMHHECVVHSSEPNRSDHRRIGYAIHYCATSVYQDKYKTGDGRPTAALVRGVDEFGHWQHEARTEVDFDPTIWEWAEEQRHNFFARGRDR